MGLKARLVAVTILVAVAAGCAGSTTSPTPAGPTATPAPPTTAPADPTESTGPAASLVPSMIGSVGPFPETGCPESDAAFCTQGAAVAKAIVAGDAAAIVALSRPDVFRCSEVDATIFTGCASAQVLEGHPIGTAGGVINVYAPAAYHDRLDGTMKSITPSFTDNAGTGEARVLGTSVCGPNDPARRSYYVAWTAALPGTSGPDERVVGLYEFTFREDRWRVGILYLDTVGSWGDRHADPLRDVGCGIAPWGAA